MFKKLLLAIAASVALTGVAAAMDVNTASEAQLETLKGIGPTHAKAIVEERNAHGPFKDASDLAGRVKGLGGKSVAKLQAEGMTIGAGEAAGKPADDAKRKKTQHKSKKANDAQNTADAGAAPKK